MTKLGIALVSTALALAAAGPAQATFPGGNGRIGFTAAPSACGSDIDECSLNGGLASVRPSGQRLHRIAGRGDFMSYSASGRSIVFADTRDTSAGDDGDDSLVIARSDGSRARRLTSDRDGPNDGSPHWSPRGSAVVFSRENDLYVINQDGTGLRLLVRDGFEPAWSSRGDIAFARGNLIYVIRPDGSGLRRLVRGESPDFSPDGRTLAFSRDGDVFRIRADGRRLRRVLRTRGLRESEPVWSPNARYIAFSRLGRPDRLYVMRSNGRNRLRIARGSSPSWQPRL